MDMILNGILTAYFLVITVLYPLYIQDGYHGIGDTKFYFFRDVTLVTAGTLFLLLAIKWLYQLLCRKKKISISEYYRNLSVTDWFVYGYMISILISYLFTLYQKDAFWGTNGWYMGMCSQFMFIGIYVFFSRYYIWRKEIFYAVFGGSLIVFLLGILNRYSVYPIVLDGRQPDFISTLGNINWFSGYLAVMCPLGMVWYWSGITGRMASVVYVCAAFIAGIVQGSNSAGLIFIATFLLLLYHSFEENDKMLRFLELCLLFVLACQAARMLRYVPGLEFNYEGDLSRILADGNLTLYIGIGILVLYIFLHFMIGNRQFRISRYQIMRHASWIFGIGIPILYAVLLIANTYLGDGIPGLAGNPVFTFDLDWANARGSTWRSGIYAYLLMSPLQKLVGIGPDCYVQYIYSVPDLAGWVYAQFGDARLTNAHNEWLTVLVNLGALGLFCYAGIFISAGARYLKKAKEQPMFYLFAAAVFSYSIHNMVSFQQILSTPFIFLIMGIGEGLCRKEKVDK